MDWAWIVQLLLAVAIIYVASTFLFDVLHYLLHRWQASRFRLLRTFARWHLVHHHFLDRKMRVHPGLARANLRYHIIPEYLTWLAGTLPFLLVFPWQAVAIMVVAYTVRLVVTIRQEGVDNHHMAMERVDGQHRQFKVGDSYHALHHIYPDGFYSSSVNLFDLIFGTAVSFRHRRFLVTGASGAYGSAMVKRLKRLGAEVRSLKHDVDFTADSVEAARRDLEWAEVLVLAHGAKSEDCDNANHRTFVALIDAFAEIGVDRLTPPEVWAVGSEAELHGDLGMEAMRAYAASKRKFAERAAAYYRSPDLIYRHIVPAGFRSAMGGGLMSAETAVAMSLFFIRRGFRYVPVTFTTLAYWNYFRFRFALTPRTADPGAASPDAQARQPTTSLS